MMRRAISSAVLAAWAGCGDGTPVSGDATRDDASDALTVDAPSSLRITPSPYDFMGHSLGCPATVQRFTLTNTGTAATSAVTMSFHGTGANMFEVEPSTTCTGTLAGAAACTIDVGFHPTSAGGFTTALEVNAAPDAATLYLTGSGLAAGPLQTSPGMLAYGSVIVGTQAPAQDVTLSNSCGTTMPAPTLTVAGADPADYQVSVGTCAGGIPGSGCTVSVVFTPSTTGPRTAIVNAASNGFLLLISVSGVGISALMP